MTIEKFTKDHEWIRVDGDVGTVGITDYAQSQLGDVVFVEVPEVGKQLKQKEVAAVVESVKAAGEVYAPVSGEIVAGNAEVAANTALVNEDPTGKAWLFKIRVANKAELDALMDRAAYEVYVKGLA